MLTLPMVATWRSLDRYRCDDSVWSAADIHFGMKDDQKIAWATGPYQFHQRAPRGIQTFTMGCRRHTGGIFHLQFANWRRLVAKHAWYKMDDVTRWPGRRSVVEVDSQYNAAPKDNGAGFRAIPESWWNPEIKALIRLDGIPWFEEACRTMVATHGREKFAGLDLFGVVQ